MIEVRSELPLLGRHREVAAFDVLLAETARGRFRMGLVDGEAGIGKSRLANELMERARCQGFSVWWGRARELERDRPFHPLAEALDLTPESSDPGRAGVARLLIEEPTTSSPWEAGPRLRFRIVEAFLALIEREAASAPVALVIDDIHWAEPSALLVVDQLARHLARRPVAVVATRRPSPHPPDLDRLLDSVRPDLLALRLGALEPDVVTDLLRVTLDAEPEPRLVRQVRGAGGNPLLIIELVAALGRERAIIRCDGRVDVGQVDVPPSFQHAVLRHLSFLPDASLDVLRMASVLGTSFSLDELAICLGHPSFEVLGALREPLVGGLLTEAGDDHLGFRHDLVCHAVYGDLPGSARQALHLQAARRLAAAGRPVPLVAHHFRLGASPGDTEAAGWLRRAGQAALSRAPAVAAELFDAALGLLDGGDPERDELSAELAFALVWSGRVTEGETQLRALLERPHSTAIDVPVSFTLGQALLVQGRAQEAVPVLEAPTERPTLPARERVRFLAEAALARLVTGDIDGAALRAEEAAGGREQSGDHQALCLALSVQSAVAGLRGRTSSAIALAEQAMAVSVPDSARSSSWRPPQFFLGSLLVDADRMEEGQSLIQAARRICEELGAVWDLPVYHLLAGRAHFVAGDLDDAAAEVEAGLELAREVATGVLLVWGHAILAHVWLQRGDLTAAEEALTAGEREMAATGSQVRGSDWLLWARSLLAEGLGRSDEAHAVLRLVWDAMAGLGIVAEQPLFGPDLVRLCVTTGEPGQAIEVAEAVTGSADLSGSASARAAALRCRGLAEGDPDLLLESVAAYQGSARRMERGFACEDAGVALVAAGRRDEGRKLLEDALGVYHSCRAGRAAGRTEARLRGLGVRRGARGPRGRPATGWAALTPSELEVTRLATEGLTNPEIGERMFISRRTVETHLSHVFAKLGLSSRVELAAAATRNSPQP